MVTVGNTTRLQWLFLVCFCAEMSEQDIINCAEQGEHVQQLMKTVFPNKTGMIISISVCWKTQTA